MVAFRVPPAGDLVCNSGMCPDWESNQRPFGSQSQAQSTELHQPGKHLYFEKFAKYVIYEESQKINLFFHSGLKLVGLLSQLYTLIMQDSKNTLL